MLAAVARNGRRYAELRQLHIPADTEPAFAFHPYLPGGPPTGSAPPHAALSVARASRVTVSSRLEDLAFQSVTVLSQLLERREVTSTDLTRMYIARLKRFGERLNCVVTLTEGLALEQAGEADREIRAGRYRGPLHGIPWGAKDLFATRGVRTTWGARPYEQQVIDQDATVVERLRTAGAVLVAKLSMGALALGGVWFGGSTRNPWDLSRSSSGSSAGPAAATAAGLVGFSLGTETLGSIISPSAACGVTGLRPTYGRVSRHGAMALSWTMDKIGPMCRSVEDCVLVFNVMYGPDGRDLTVVDAPFEWAPDFQSVGLRVGYVASEFAAPPDGASPDQRRVWEQEASLLRDALVALRGTGMIVEPVDLPAFSRRRAADYSQCRGRHRVRRSDAQPRGGSADAARGGRLAEQLQVVAVHPGSGVYSRAAGPHPACPGDGRVDDAVRCVRQLVTEHQPDDHEPHGAPSARAQGRVS